MRVELIRLVQIMGIESLEIKPGDVTRIEGKNGAGKSSIIEGLKSLFGGGQDVTLLRNGEPRGEVVVMLDDGTRIRKRFGVDSAKTSVRHPKYGDVSAPQKAIEALAGIAAVNPVALLLMSPKRRAAHFLDACPMPVTIDELAAAIDGEVLVKPAADASGIDTIEANRKILYNRRTERNGEAKGKRATAAQLSESLPDTTEYEVDHASTIAELRDRRKAIESEAAQVNECNRTRWNEQRAAIDAEQHESVGAVQAQYSDEERELSTEIAELQAKLMACRDRQNGLATRRSADIEAAAATAAGKVARLNSEADTARRELLSATASETAGIDAEISLLQERASQAERHRNTAGIVTRMNADAERAEQAAEALTESLDRLDALKLAILSRLPIADVEIRDGDIYRDGIPFDRLNTAMRVDIAFDVARLRCGDLPFMFVDNAECLDSDSLLHLEEKAKEVGVQLMYSCVTDGPLTIVTDPDEEPESVSHTNAITE